MTQQVIDRKWQRHSKKYTTLSQQNNKHWLILGEELEKKATQCTHTSVMAGKHHQWKFDLSNCATRVWRLPCALQHFNTSGFVFEKVLRCVCVQTCASWLTWLTFILLFPLISLDVDITGLALSALQTVIVNGSIRLRTQMCARHIQTRARVVHWKKNIRLWVSML